MNDQIKNIADEFASFAEAMKPSLATQQIMENIKKSVAKIPDFNFPSVSSPAFHVYQLPRMPTQEEINDYQSASVLMRILADEALQWQKQLPEGYHPAILAVLYGGIQINVQTLSQVSFHGIRIEGTLNGAPCSLLAHQSTVQLLCYGEKIKPDAQRSPIGFIWNDNRTEV